MIGETRPHSEMTEIHDDEVGQARVVFVANLTAGG